MPYRREWIGLLLFALALIDDIDRVTLSFAARPLAPEFGLTPADREQDPLTWVRSAAANSPS